MDWSKTKTIFIITFLLLNSFLTYQLVAKQSYESFSSEISDEEQTFEEMIATDNIIIDTELPEFQDLPQLFADTSNVPYEEVSTFYDNNDWFEDLDEEVVEDASELMLFLNEDYLIDDFGETFSFVEENIYQGEEYSFGGPSNLDEGEGYALNFFRYYNDFTLYGGGGNAHLVITFNEDNEITVVEQQFPEIQEREEERELIMPEEAVEALIDAQVLTRNATIHSVELAYYSSITEGALAVYVPVYRIRASNDVFDNEDDIPSLWQQELFIVNADSGHVTSDESLSNE